MFEPIGNLSRLDTAWRVFRDLPDESLVLFEDMPFDKEIMYAIREQLAKRLEREQQRTLLSVRGEGWRLVRGIAQVALADRRRRLAGRQVRRARHLIETTDRSEMSAFERERTDDLTIRLARFDSQAWRSGRAIGMDEIRRWKGDTE